MSAKKREIAVAYTSHHSTNYSALSERAQYLLKTLIERYIRDGQPVGSRTLSRDSGLDLSPATVRNVMADLEEMGFLHSPHTSAGRVPTARGYRFFIDSLVQLKSLHGPEIEDLRRRFDPDQGTAELVRSISSLLAEITQMAALVTLPRRESLILRHVEFLPLSENRVLVILVINQREVQNRIIHVRRPYSAAELQQAANYLNAEFAGKEINQIREELLRDMRAARETMNRLMQTVIEMADKVFEPDAAADEDYVLTGEVHLMEFSELSDLDKLRQLFEAFNQKREILHLLDQCLHAHGVQIFIGEESGFDVLDACSLVTAPYALDEKAIGVLGVIGPTRMAYERVIPIVDISAKLLASALNSRD